MYNNEIKKIITVLRSQESTEMSLKLIVNLKLFPWIKSYNAYFHAVMLDMVGENHLQAEIKGNGKARRIYIHSKNILTYLEQYAKENTQ